MVKKQKKEGTVKNSSSKVKKAILGVAVAIMLALFIGYGINVFYKEPKYEDFCGDRYEFKNYMTKESCEANNGKWNIFEKMPLNIQDDQYLCTRDVKVEGTFIFECTTKEKEDIDEGSCDPDYYCRQDLDQALEPYNRNVFFVTLILGIIFLLIGTIYVNVDAVGSGLMGGSVITMIYGTLRYWGDMQDWLRFIILGVALGILIWMGYKYFRK